MLDFSALYNQRSKLNKFIQENDLKSIKSLLVESYMNLNYTDSVDGQTPLHKTCQTGNIAIAKLLIEYGACQNIQNNAGWFPMHLASYYGHMDIFFLLIKSAQTSSAKVNIKPLHIDSEYSDKDSDDELSSTCVSDNDDESDQESDQLNEKFNMFNLD